MRWLVSRTAGTIRQTVFRAAGLKLLPARRAATPLLLTLLAGMGLFTELNRLIAQGQNDWSYRFDETTVSPGESVQLPSTEVGATGSVQFVITNIGTAAQSIDRIDFPEGVIFVENRPSLPATVNPASSLMFDIQYQPTIPGRASASLAIDGATFPIVGVGLVPSGSVAISPGGTIEPATQPSATLGLGQSFPILLKGTLSLSFTPNNATDTGDPVIMFETGTTRVDFAIPENMKPTLDAKQSSVPRATKPRREAARARQTEINNK